MEKLKRLIGPAPSEREHDDLVSFVRSRQEIVASVLQEFRDRMSGSRRAKAAKTPRKRSETASLTELLKGMKELGLTVEDLKKMKGETHG